MVLDFLAVDKFDFTRKIVKKIWGFVKIEFLDKNLTFRIVCGDDCRNQEKICIEPFLCDFYAIRNELHRNPRIDDSRMLTFFSDFRLYV